MGTVPGRRARRWAHPRPTSCAPRALVRGPVVGRRVARLIATAAHCTRVDTTSTNAIIPLIVSACHCIPHPTRRRRALPPKARLPPRARAPPRTRRPFRIRLRTRVARITRLAPQRLSPRMRLRMELRVPAIEVQGRLRPALCNGRASRRRQPRPSSSSRPVRRRPKRLAELNQTPNSCAPADDAPRLSDYCGN